MAPPSGDHQDSIYQPPRRISVSDSLVKLRDAAVISPGGSQSLHLQLSSLQHGPRKTTAAAEEQLTYITSIMQDISWALQELAHPQKSALVPAQLEQWACFLDRQLSQASRNYHSVAHIFEVSAGAGPLQVLAAFFRDCVDHAIDAIGPAQDEETDEACCYANTANSHIITVPGVLQDYLRPGSHSLSPHLSGRDVLVARIFGYEPGQDLTTDGKAWHKGLDIFLSAVVATRLLRPCLTITQEAQLCVCLEATIPNRWCPNISSSCTNQEQQQHPLETLHERLTAATADFDLELSADDIIETVQQACDLWNRQVGNMMSDELATVLDHTWRLLPEINPALRKRALYKLSDYHLALQSMTAFIGNLKGSCIVMEFRGIPPPLEVLQFEAAVNQNMDLVLLYIKVRLVTVAVVAAFAALSGGDAPKSFFFGDEPLGHETDCHMDQLGDCLLLDELHTDSTTIAPFHQDVYRALCGEHGMSETTSFDTQRAPLAAYLYRSLGGERMSQLLSQCHILDGPLPFEEARCWEILRFLPPAVTTTVAEELARFTVSRKAALAKIVRLL